MAVRPAAVAGMFYPDNPRELRGEVDRLLDAPAASRGPTGIPKALIVPHAGYVYSGPVAASAYARLAPIADAVRRVVLLGPAHRVGFDGIALPGVTGFATPLGVVPIDAEAAAIVRRLPQVRDHALAHVDEHSLEVELPFLQRTLGEFKLLPLLVGHASAALVADVLDLLWGGPETLIVVSSDLSHYHAYADARLRDRATAEQILAGEPTLDHEQACGATPVNGLLRVARVRGLGPTLLDLRNSGDTAGDRRRVVGYAAFQFAEERRNAAH